VELAPTYEYGRKWFGEYLAIAGKMDAAVAQLQTAVDEHPASPVARAGLCRVLYFAGRLPEAAAQCQISLDAYPEFRMAHVTMYEIEADLGNGEAAVAHWLGVAGIKASGDDPYMQEYRRGRIDAVWRRWRREMPENAYYARAQIAMRLGEPEGVLDLLERARQQHEFMMTWVSVEPVFQPLHEKPGFQAILRRMGL
jgi:tetratricopeptide (TPR) repeat protein